MTSSQTKLIVGICGTTENTVRCAEILRAHDQFEISWIVTPPPRPVGRHQDLTPSPLQVWAELHNIPVIHVEKSLKEVREELEKKHQSHPIDFLLVVDFGYLIPQWLLDLPKQAAVNIHPSELPKYRGSSPGQYALLFGETTSALTIMRMEAGLDTGPIIQQIPFAVSSQETQQTYYDKGFTLAEQHLAQTLLTYQPENEEIQTVNSPTPIAQRFHKQDGFIPYEMLQGAQQTENLPLAKNWSTQLGEPLQQVLSQQALTAQQLIDRMVRAFDPWPGVWTIVPEYKNRKNVRQKILQVTIHPQTNVLRITGWQYDGEKPKTIA